MAQGNASSTEHKQREQGADIASLYLDRRVLFADFLMRSSLVHPKVVAVQPLKEPLHIKMKDLGYCCFCTSARKQWRIRRLDNCC
eukprot:1136764-Pelagomonas_calceolata.AAC.8